MFCSTINSFNSSPQLGRICLLVHGLNKISPFFRVGTQMRFWMFFISFGSSGDVGSHLRKLSRLVITSSISAGTCSSYSLWHRVEMSYDAALSRIYERSSHLFGSLLEGNACSWRPPPLVCIGLSLPDLASHRFYVELGWWSSSSVI